jgi:hypothetical protein
MSADEFRRHGHAVVDWIADYWSTVEQHPVVPAAPPGTVAEQQSRRRGAIASPNEGVDSADYPNELVAKEAEQLKSAESFLFDGSDLLPGTLGQDFGTLLQNIIKNPNQANSLLDDYQAEAETAFASG